MSCIVQPGKYGDICNVLPLAYHEYEETKEKPYFVVAKQFASILDGCSYVIPAIYDGNWQDLAGAIRFARSNFSNVVVTCTNGNSNGKNFPIAQSEASFQLDQWKRAGMKDHFDEFPLVFDERSKRRERGLLDKFATKESNPYEAHNRPKYILIGDESQSSPFPQIGDLIKIIQDDFGSLNKVILLSTVKAEFIFDLLGLYEKAVALISVETVHLHLSKAVDVPTFALLRDGWRGSMPSKKFKASLKYSQWQMGRTDFLLQIQRHIFPNLSATTVSGSPTKPPEPPSKPPEPPSKPTKKVISLVFRKDQLINNTFTLRRTAALGDTLAATCVAKKLSELGHPVIFQSDPSTHCILSRVPYVLRPEKVDGAVHVDMDRAYEDLADRKTTHFYNAFINRANQALDNWSITLPSTNLCPRMEVTQQERDGALAHMSKHPRPWVIICPRSNHWLNRTVPNVIWEEAVKDIQGTKFWLGNDKAPAGIVDLKCRHFDNAIKFIACSDLMVTVDTGPMHVAAALRVPVVAIEQSSSPALHLSDQQDWVSIAPNLDCLNCQQNTCPLDAKSPPCQKMNPAVIAKAVNERLAVCRDGVSAIICIYRPTAGSLQRCINAVLPQVNEIIVVGQHNSIVPVGAPRDPKIKYVTRPGQLISYGRNANFGARFANHSHLLLLNDDCFLESDVVHKLKSCMTDNVGIVSHLYRYPDGKIQHGGKHRAVGSMGWGHIDHNAIDSRIRSVTEMENVCLASALVSRKAFFDCEGFDEDFAFYSEDDCLCLQMRHRGYKILYNPHAMAIHVDHMSTRNVIGINDIVPISNQMLERKWGWKIKTDNPIFK